MSDDFIYIFIVILVGILIGVLIMAGTVLLQNNTYSDGICNAVGLIPINHNAWLGKSTDKLVCVPSNNSLVNLPSGSKVFDVDLQKWVDKI